MQILPVGRYREMIRVLAKYGLSDLCEELGLDRRYSPRRVKGIRAEGPEELRAHHLRRALEELGPTYIKLGQVLSTRPDILPVTYIREFERLQDQVPPFGCDQVRRLLETELRAPIEDRFTVFYETPIASASLSQAHEAILRTGEQVIVKVQRPDARSVIAQDIVVLRSLARVVSAKAPWAQLYDVPGIVDELDRSLRAELDFTLERQNLEVMARQLESFERIRVPRVFTAVSTARVIVLERVFGQKPDGSFRDTELAVELLRAFLKQFAEDGFFHADPHPGNVLVTREGFLYLLDLGMVGFLDSRTRRGFVKLLLSMLGHRGDTTAEILAELGEPGRDFERQEYRLRIGQLISKFNNMRFNLGEVLIEASRIGYTHHLRAHPQLTLMFKALSQIDGILVALDPDLDPIRALRPYLAQMVSFQIGQLIAPVNLADTALEWTEVQVDLPRRLSLLLDKLNADNRLRFQIEQISLTGALEPVGKWINRLVLTGLFASIMLFSGLMLMARVGPLWSGLSVLGLAGLVVAIACAFYLLALLARTKLL